MSEISALQDQLKGKGYRKSSFRENILTYLLKSSSPLSAKEILDSLEADNLFPNKTTVYREIEKLLKERLILEIDLLDGKKRYEIYRTNDHHHHAVCTSCGKVECIDMANDLDAIENQITSKTKFRVESHVLEFFGTCAQCQTISRVC
jgi:Fe2+ or Zn2+ uptake regulation protein